MSFSFRPSRLLFLIVFAAFAAGFLPAIPSAAQQSSLVGDWPNVDAMSGMKSRFSTAAGDLQGGAQIAPAIGLPHFALGETEALVLSGDRQSCLSVPGQVVDTSGSYTVSAWVKLNRLTGTQTVAAMDGTTQSAFFLQFRDDSRSFAFVTTPADAGQPGITTAAFLPAQAGRWYWLIGVHDAAAKTQSLYVDGVLQQTRPYAGAWTSPGPLTIGRARYNGKPVDFVDGRIADVQVYSGVYSFNGADLQDAAARAAALDAKAAVPAAVTLDLASPEKPSSPNLYGLMIEDIGHSIDGGLYAELIQNRDFKDNLTKPVHWTALQSGGFTASLSVDALQDPPAGTTLKTSLRITRSGMSAVGFYGAMNDGYGGIPVKPKTPYHLSFYAKCGAANPGTVAALLQTPDMSTIYAQTGLISLTPQWRKYTAILLTKSGFPADGNGRLYIQSIRPVSGVWITHVSLMPPTYGNRPNGARIDLMKRLAAMHPAFLRLPGGNFLEGNTIAERFDWKKTLGPTEDRPGHHNPWGYPSTDGFGLLEYLEWCEDLSMKPVLGVYAGYSLDGEYVKPGSALAPYVQDALDEIEYVTGDPKTTKWGAVRAANGHPAPFLLRYVEIGNEDFFDKSGSYEAGRFAQFFDAIRAKYPKLEIIATTGAVKSRRPDLIDEHYYRSPQEFIRDTAHYDSYNRADPKIFVGEWASQEGTPNPDMGACLGDAAWMCGIERNSDHVVLSSYAPLLTNIGQGAGPWGTNLIAFNNLTSYSSPTYYAQAMFAAAHGKTIVPLTLSANAALIGSATRTTGADGSSVIYLKLVNPTDALIPAQIALQGLADGAVLSHAAVVTLRSNEPTETNKIDDPHHITPIKSVIENASSGFTYPTPPFSVTVMTLKISRQTPE